MYQMHFRLHNGLRLHSNFLWKDFIAIFLHDAFHFCDRQRSQKLILHQIIDAYPRIGFINKGLSIAQKIRVRFDSLEVILFGVDSNQ